MIIKENYLSVNSEVCKLNDKINRLEQHLRECNIEIHGIVETKGENLHAITQKMCEAVAVNLSSSDLVSCVRVAKLNKDSNRPRTIIAKLCSRMRRDEVLSGVTRYNKANKGNKLNTLSLGLSDIRTPIYVSEHLSPHYKALHAAARLRAKERGYKFIWIRNGNIYVRKEESSRYILIKSDSSLELIV